MSEDTIYIGCECHSPYHIVRVSMLDWDAEDPPELFIELQADRCLGLWGRIKHAIRYVFGHENLGWHDVIPSKSDIDKLGDLVDRYRAAYDRYEEKKNENKTA